MLYSLNVTVTNVPSNVNVILATFFLHSSTQTFCCNLQWLGIYIQRFSHMWLAQKYPWIVDFSKYEVPAKTFLLSNSYMCVSSALQYFTCDFCASIKFKVILLLVILAVKVWCCLVFISNSFILATDIFSWVCNSNILRLWFFISWLLCGNVENPVEHLRWSFLWK